MLQDKNSALSKYLSRLDVWGMAFGVMVGWGIFVMPGTTFLPVAGPLGTLIAMLAGMAIMLVIGYNFSYLMGRNGQPGGVYAYAKEAFGRDHAFLSSWFLCLSYLTVVFLNATALFIVARLLLGDALQIGYSYTVAGHKVFLTEAMVSVVSLAMVGTLFLFLKGILHKLQTIFALILFIGIVIIGIICLPKALATGALTNGPVFGTAGLNPFYGIFSLVILAPWAFVGFDVACFETYRFKFAPSKSKWIIATAIILAAISYISIALVGVAVVPEGFSSWSDYVSKIGTLQGVVSVPVFYGVKEIMGPFGLVVLGITAVAAILTGLIGGYRAIVRILSTMAEDRILSDGFSKTTNSILFIMVISIVLALLGRNTLNWFVDLTSFGAIVGFGYVSAAAWKIAKTENNSKVRVAGGIGTIISIILVVVQLVPRLAAMEAMGSAAFLLLSLWCLLGFVFYWSTIRRSSLAEYSGMSISGVVLFALLLYSAIMWVAKLLYAKAPDEVSRDMLVFTGVVLLAIVFIGLVVMLYVQNQVRKKNELVEREKIRAVEGSLAKSQFLFNMSHDIRTPMNAIIGYTNLAMKEPASENLHSYLKKIDMSSQHLLTLINDILEMSRIESGKVELEFSPEDLCKIFESIRDLFAEQMKQKKINFQLHLSQVKNNLVWCDKKNLNRVLLNVLSNAFKFTPERGSVNVSLWEVGAGEEGYGFYEIRIQDTGIGMSKDFVGKIFTAFERERSSTNSRTEGTGLGLAITKSIVDMMGGTIEVLTSLGNGTEIIIRVKFKLATEEDLLKYGGDKPEESDEGASSEVSFAGKRALLVEDNLVNLEIAKMILLQTGFAVETAENGKAAVEMVEKSAPGYYDLILMDIQMPVMDGYTATKNIRLLENKALAQIPIVAMTANAFAEDVKAAEDAGMQAHIAKPVDVKLMIKTLARVLDGRKA